MNSLPIKLPEMKIVQRGEWFDVVNSDGDVLATATSEEIAKEFVQNPLSSAIVRAALMPREGDPK